MMSSCEKRQTKFQIIFIFIPRSLYKEVNDVMNKIDWKLSRRFRNIQVNHSHAKWSHQ